MKHYTKATKAEIQEKAFTMPEYETLLDLLPEHLPMTAIFYDIEHLYEVEIGILVEPLIEEVTLMLTEKYPFLSVFGLEENIKRDYFNYYFSEVTCLDLPRKLVEGTELEYVEVIYYRSEES